MTDPGHDRPSLAERAAALLKRPCDIVAPPTGYRPALGVLACAPALLGLLASASAAQEDRRSTIAARDGRPHLEAIEAARADERRRTALAPFVRARPVTRELADLLAMLPDDASLHAVSRDARGVVRAEVDCANADALSGAGRSAPASGEWRMIGQAIMGGGGVRVTLERMS